MTDEDVSVEDQQDIEGDAVEEMSDEDAEQAKLAEAVTVEIEDAGTLRKKLSVAVDREYIQGRRSEQFAELKREAQVDGFRRGRAPLRLIERRFGRDVGDQMTGPLIGNAFLAALKKEDLEEKTIGDPRVWVQVAEERPGETGGKTTVLADKLVELEKAIEHIHLPEEGPLTFACEVELRPEFDLPELEGIPLEEAAVKITKQMVSDEIDRIRATRGHYAPVTTGNVKEDDLLVVDYKCSVGDRVLAEDLNRTVPARDQRMEGIIVDGLGKALVGKKADQAVTVEAKVPDDHESAELRGQQAKFELTIRDIKRLELPDIDEGFLSALGVESEQDLQETVRQEMGFRRQQMVQQQMRAGVREYLLEKTKLEIPAGLSQRQTDRAIARRMMDLYRLGIPQQDIEKQIDGLKASAAEEAAADLKFFFIMEKVADKLEVDVSEEELNNAIATIAQRRGRRFDRVRDELSQAGGIQSLYVQIRDEKIMDKLVEDAKIAEKPSKSPKKVSSKKKS